jgi:hypothetical protein
MSSAPSLPFLRRRKKRQLALADAPNDHPIEIVTPDVLSAALLLEYAAPSFPAEIESGSPCTVTLHPPPAGGRWVLELLALVERWLESTRFPSANVLYGGRNYVIRPSVSLGTTTTSASAPAAETLL